MHTTSEDIELTITGIAHGGVFVARHEGRVVFVSDAIVGETVRARVTDQRKKSFWRADAVEVLTASPDRVPHVWRSADISVTPEHRPGGAEFGHIALPAQRALKAEVLRDSLQRFGGIDRSVPVQAVSSETDERGWRTRMSVHVDNAGRVGAFAARSHRVIETPDFPLADGALEEAVSTVHAEPGSRVELVLPADGRVRRVQRELDPRGAQETIIERVGNREFQLDAGGFWQVHHAAADTLDRAVRSALAGYEIDPDAAHLDLYGGVGLFAATLGELGAKRITSVEADARATEHAGENLAEWIGARAETARTDRFLRATLQNASATERDRLSRGVVVLDPPRAGAGKEVVQQLGELGPDRIVYVACDPVALSRDLKSFAEVGYAPAGMEAFDLFPYSHHFETIAVLEKQSD